MLEGLASVLMLASELPMALMLASVLPLEGLELELMLPSVLAKV